VVVVEDVSDGATVVVGTSVVVVTARGALRHQSFGPMNATLPTPDASSSDGGLASFNARSASAIAASFSSCVL
jgi:hypothetical protein